MGKDIKRKFQSFNGNDWDRHLFETSEDQIVTGFKQSLASDYAGKWAYKTFPGKLALAWCHIDWGKFTSYPAAGGVRCVVNYPFTFKNGCIAFATAVYSAGLPQVAVMEVRTSNCSVVTSNAPGIGVDLFVIGEVA